MIIDTKKRKEEKKEIKKNKRVVIFFLSFLSFGYCKVHKPHPSLPQPSAFQPHQTSTNTKEVSYSCCDLSTLKKALFER